KEVLKEQKEYFSTQETKSISFRKTLLKKLKSEIIRREKEICNALYADFKKPEFESLVTETQFVLAEITELIKNMDRWSRPERVAPSLANFPSTDRIYKEPYGNVLVISPWNYPFQLAMRSEEHTSELQSRENIVCRLLLEKKKTSSR